MRSPHTSHASSKQLATRPAAVAGTFYPAKADYLRQSVLSYLYQAQIPPLPGTVRAVIAPHAGYVYSGPIAGFSFRALAIPPEDEFSVLLLGPAHYVPVTDVALGEFSAFETPLGKVEVDLAVLKHLQESGPYFAMQPEAHLPEHCLEVQIPFLQVISEGRCRLAPMLMAHDAAQPVAEVLASLLTEHPTMRVVVSSDLSHYYPYERARALDHALLQAIVAGDFAAVARGEACGRVPILVLMHIARLLGWQAHVLDYRNSGDTAGDRRRVVGYGAIAYTGAES